MKCRFESKQVNQNKNAYHKCIRLYERNFVWCRVLLFNTNVYPSVCPDDLQRALCETQQLLGELSHMTRQQTPSVTTFSETIQAVEEIVSTELHELAR